MFFRVTSKIEQNLFDKFNQRAFQNYPHQKSGDDAFPQPHQAETNVDQNLYQQTTTLLQDFWILRLWFCDDRDLSGSPVGNPPPAGTQSQHKEDQVGQSLIGGSLRKNFVADLKER